MAECRFCLAAGTPGDLITPCSCKGSMAHVHQRCLQRWLRERFRRQFRTLSRGCAAGATGLRCELCHSEFHGELVPVPVPQQLRTIFSSRTSYYIIVHIPLILYLAYRFQRLLRHLVLCVRREVARLLAFGTRHCDAKKAVSVCVRIAGEVIPVAVFGSALPVFVWNTLMLLRLLRLECKEFRIRSQSCGAT